MDIETDPAATLAFERDLFGILTDTTVSNDLRLPTYSEIGAVQKQRYDNDPRNPTSKLALTLLAQIRQFLPDTRAHELGIWCCLGTTLHSEKGISGWFALSTATEKIVTIKLSTNKRSHPELNIDIVICKDEIEYNIAMVGLLIASKIIQKDKSLWRQRVVRKL